MALLFLDCGYTAYVDDEDIERVQTDHWGVRAMRPSKKMAVHRKVMVRGRVANVFLHRLIAVRMRPELQGQFFIVTPTNGDYMDCRRANLEITVRQRRPGDRAHYGRKAPNRDLPADLIAVLSSPIRAKSYSRRSPSRHGGKSPVPA